MENVEQESYDFNRCARAALIATARRVPFEFENRRAREIRSRPRSECKRRRRSRPLVSPTSGVREKIINGS